MEIELLLAAIQGKKLSPEEINVVRAYLARLKATTDTVIIDYITPPHDSVYARLDATNQPFTNDVTVQGNVTSSTDGHFIASQGIIFEAGNTLTISTDDYDDGNPVNDYENLKLEVYPLDSTNLAVNGDFATGDFTGWTQTNTPTIQSADVPPGYTYAAQISTASTVAAVGQTVTNTFVRGCVVTFWAKGNVVANIYMNNGGGSLVGEKNWEYPTTTVWRKYSFTLLNVFSGVASSHFKIVGVAGTASYVGGVRIMSPARYNGIEFNRRMVTNTGGIDINGQVVKNAGNPVDAQDLVTLATITGGYQPIDATLTSIATLGTAADKMLYTTAADTWAETAITPAGRALMNDATAAAQLATLGLAGGTTGQFWRGDGTWSNTFLSNILIGSSVSGSITPALDIVNGSGYGIIISNVVTDTTTKACSIGVRHYTNAEKAMLVFRGTVGNGISIVTLGGGSSLWNAAMEIEFYTAANSTTVTGTSRGKFNSAGNLLLGTATDGMTAAGSLAIAKDLVHRGTLAGFFNVTPAARPGAFTQTYSTASHTVPAMTYVAPSGGVVVDTEARASLAQLAADVLAQLKVITAVIDDGQSLGLLQ